MSGFTISCQVEAYVFRGNLCGIPGCGPAFLVELASSVRARFRELRYKSARFMYRRGSQRNQVEDTVVRQFQPTRLADVSRCALDACAVMLLVALMGVAAASASPDGATLALDDQVQEIKSDVLAIAAELEQLEEKLLYPSHTQVVVFVSLAEGHEVVLDSVRIEIDGKPVARHIYSLRELEAFRKGGVQRIYTGNISTGQHRVGVTMIGRPSGGFDFEESASFAFTKEIGPAVVELELSARTVSGARIALRGL
jgi:hypothetical protein